jgi:hypothetical protein
MRTGMGAHANRAKWDLQHYKSSLHKRGKDVAGIHPCEGALLLINNSFRQVGELRQPLKPLTLKNPSFNILTL